jgi:lipid kinase YegS
MKKVRVILNGKGAANPQVRAAINQIREEGQPLEVRCTWEGGDAARFAQEAMSDGIDVLVAGGGDGTINEVVNGILSANTTPKMALGALPLGTANDFARGCGIPLDPYDALKLATEGEPVSIDIPSANGVYFANVASGGFGAEITVGTNPQLKKALGGGAYALTGIVTAAKMEPYSGRFVSADEEAEGPFIVLAVGNARQAGGGFQVTRNAMLDDGLLDVMAIADFQTKDLGIHQHEEPVRPLPPGAGLRDRARERSTHQPRRRAPSLGSHHFRDSAEVSAGGVAGGVCVDTGGLRTN